MAKRRKKTRGKSSTKVSETSFKANACELKKRCGAKRDEGLRTALLPKTFSCSAIAIMAAQRP